MKISLWGPYSACDDGTIWSGDRRLKGTPNSNGYLRVFLKYEGMTRTFYVHRLICRAFHGDPGPNEECRHLDGTRTNNAADNLLWSDKETNEQDKIAHGTVVRGEKNGVARLTENSVREATKLASSGMPPDEIARIFGVAPHTIRDAIFRRRWKHVEGGLTPYSTRRKLKSEDIERIRVLRASGMKQKEIGEIFGVTQSAISMVLDGLTHLSRP